MLIFKLKKSIAFLLLLTTMFACNSSKEEVRCRVEKEKGRKAKNSLKVQQKHTAAKEKKNSRKKQKKKTKKDQRTYEEKQKVAAAEKEEEIEAVEAKRKEVENPDPLTEEDLREKTIEKQLQNSNRAKKEKEPKAPKATK